MSDLMTVILVRLCECEGNVARLICRHGNLTEEGRRQAEALHRVIAPKQPVAVLAPENDACRQTASLIAGQGAVETAPAFREPPYPAWAGLTLDEVASEWPREWTNYLDPGPGDADRPIAPGGESFRTMYERAKDGLDLAFTRHRDAGGPIVIVTHGEITRLLTVGLLGAPLENLFRIRSQNGSASHFSYDGDRAIFDTINDTSHLGGLSSTDLVWQATGR